MLKKFQNSLIGASMALLLISSLAQGQRTIGTTSQEGQGPATPPPGPPYTICHATSSAANPWTLLTNQPNTQGHFTEEGTPEAGHEQDILNPVGGVCPATGPGSPGAVPEPITMILFGAGLAGVGFAARRRKQKAGEDTV